MRRFVELMLLRRVGLERWVVILKRLLLDFSAGVYVIFIPFWLPLFRTQASSHDVFIFITIALEGSRIHTATSAPMSRLTKETSGICGK